MPNKTKNKQNQQNIIFGKQNYILIAAGIGLIAIGFLLMMGGASEDPNKFNADELYSFRRITLAPILVVLGLVVEMFAVMKKPKNEHGDR